MIHDITFLIFPLVKQDSIGQIGCVGLKRANEIIGPTTEELVIKVKQTTPPK